MKKVIMKDGTSSKLRLTYEDMRINNWKQDDILEIEAVKVGELNKVKKKKEKGK